MALQAVQYAMLNKLALQQMGLQLMALYSTQLTQFMLLQATTAIHMLGCLLQVYLVTRQQTTVLQAVQRLLRDRLVLLQVGLQIMGLQ